MGAAETAVTGAETLAGADTRAVPEGTDIAEADTFTAATTALLCTKLSPLIFVEF